VAGAITIYLVGDERLIASLEAAVIATPRDVPLRLHLADMLVDAGRIESASTHYVGVLQEHPDDLRALLGAARTAELLHRPTQAAAYRRLAGLLSSPTAEEAAAHGSTTDGQSDESTGKPEDRERAPVGAAPAEDEYDLFLAGLIAESDAEVGRPSITLADVGGLDTVKQRLQSSFLGPARNPKLRRIYGTTLQGGLLLYGPPGCGKTFIAKALAGELGARFSSIGISDILDMWLGNSEKALHETFEKARQNTPCVLFIDELDALGMKRSNLARSGGRGVVVQLLTELDGAKGNNDGLFVLGATNQPWDVDPALRRPGRFDRTVLVLPPDRAARRTIVSLQMKDRHSEDLDIDWIAARTEGFSGADLGLLCNAAAESALADSITSSTNRPISQTDFKTALGGVRPSTRQWFDAARSFAMFAKENGDYDELLNYMTRHKLR
jgi:SpoVK/Ycf46/Vps4 family AAA+-type ATPase